MKPMIYKNESIHYVLAEGELNGYKYQIISRGTHPCAYVELPSDHPFMGNGYVDGYYDNRYMNLPIRSVELTYDCGTTIGWDYAHLGDFFGANPSAGGHQYTTEEIFEDVKNVIEECVQAQEKENWANYERKQKRLALLKGFSLYAAELETLDKIISENIKLWEE